MKEALQAALYPDDGENTFAILDGASCETLLAQLAVHRPEHVCLYAGDLAPDLARCAPYLVKLPSEAAFTDWLLADGFGRHWGIFARSAGSLRDLRKHFRAFLLVQEPAGKKLYFRFYDPRVLRVYLPTCEEEELSAFFGPVSRYFVEGAKPPRLTEFTEQRGALGRKRLELSA